MNSKTNPRNPFGRNFMAIAIVSITVLCAVFLFNPMNSTSKMEEGLTEKIDYIPEDDPSRARDDEGDTFSIVAYDPVSGEIGGAGCSCYSGTIDFLSDPIRHPSTGVLLGAIHTQAAYNSTNQAAARARMEAGDTPQQIIDWLVANDPGSGTIGSRQYGIVGIDSNGNISTAGYTGSSNGFWAGDIQGVDPGTGMHYSIQGNILDTSTAGSGRQDILDDMEAAFINTTGSLSDKLMAALQGAKRVGGDNRCTSSGTSGRAAFVKVLLPSDPNDNSPSIDISLYPNISWVEPIDELQCAYDSAYAPPTCRETVNTYPYTMDFEEYMWIKDENNCSPSNTTNSWIRSRHSTPTANTGPNAASQGQLYMFVEADQGTNDRAIVTSPCFEIPSSGTTVITFDYHMFGASMGTLNLTVNDGSGWSTLWSRSGSQGNNWNFQEQVDLSAYAGGTIRLRFDGTTGSGTTSDMAIDNIRIGTPPPPPPPVSCTNTIDVFDYAQGFEGTGSGGLGLWEQASGDDGDWVNFTGSTPSGNTGPSSANEGSYYMYIEASSNGTTGEIGADATAILESPCFDLTYAQGVDFTFDYHSWGANAGSLVLQLSEFDGIWIDVFSINGVNNNAWVPTTVALDGYTGQNIKLRFVGTTGGGFASDIAIDNLAMTLSCRNTSEYTGGSWVGGTPTLSNEATITDSYTTATDGGSIDACELTVSTGATLRISAGDYLNVNGDITVNGGTLIVEHQANVVQLDPDATVSVINGGTINVEVETPPLKERDFMLLGSPMTAETRNDVFSSSYNVQQHTPANFIPHPSVPAGG
ncbi:DUF1028 domain-containing protein, partial [Aureitalea sp. L0-47]|uniref:DUF1028 domain-containing protein n=1 Tax=Aureitalea sp. L0-47 TaxID=2816962 RepID=UPI002236F6F0